MWLRSVYVLKGSPSSSNTIQFRKISAMLVNNLKETLDAAGPTTKDELKQRLEEQKPLYPHNNSFTLTRSCKEEILEPITGTSTGKIPTWVKGTLLRNGAGNQEFGDTKFEHFFDGSAHLHRFAVNNGEVTYQSRFIKTNTYNKNKAANRIVMNEFGTRALPDPCQSIFQRVSALFNPGENLTDNANISVYPFGDEYYCFTETPAIFKVDPTTLDTLTRVDVSKHVAIVNHTSHPHVWADGSVYNQGMSRQTRLPHYAIVKFPNQDTLTEKSSGQMFEKAEIVASVKARWPLHPSYMHSFGITENYYIIIEQPLTISVPSMFKAQFLGEAMAKSVFRYYKDEKTLMHVVERNTGKIHRTYMAEAFFYFHTANQFEKDNHLVIDICCYSDPEMIDCLYMESLKNMNKNPDYARMFRGRPLRFVLPLDPQKADAKTDLVTLEGSSAAAHWEGNDVLVKPELMCNAGLEMPRFNYTRLGKPYRYLYGVSSDVDRTSPGSLLKVDIDNHTVASWGEPDVYPSEPIFIPSPDPKSEDDGVVMSALIYGAEEKQVALVVLDAASWTELGRTVFQTPSPVPSSLHGWFIPQAQ